MNLKNKLLSCFEPLNPFITLVLPPLANKPISRPPYLLQQCRKTPFSMYRHFKGSRKSMDRGGSRGGLCPEMDFHWLVSDLTDGNQE